MRVSPARVLPDTITVILTYDPEARVWYGN